MTNIPKQGDHAVAYVWLYHPPHVLAMHFLSIQIRIHEK
jgi:hypothetical protein